MATRLADLAQLIDGTLVGDGSKFIHAAAPLEIAHCDEIAFLDSPDKAHRLARSKAGALLVPAGLCARGLSRDSGRRCAYCVCTDRASLSSPPRRKRRRVSIQAIISWTAKLGDEVQIEPGAMIGDDVDHRRPGYDSLRRPHHGRLSHRRRRDDLSRTRCSMKTPSSGRVRSFTLAR